MNKFKPSKLLLLGVLFSFALLVSCTKLDVFKPYYITLDQGNIFTQDQIDEIKIGMNSRQVRFVLGTPTLIDILNPHRWDYLYTLTEQDELTIQQHIVIIFEENAVIDIQRLKVADEV